MIKIATVDDYDEAVKLHNLFRKDEFGLPRWERIIGSATSVNSSGDMVAFGVLTPIIESMIVMDNSKPLKEKVIALRELILFAIQGVTDKADGIHAFVQDPVYADSLKKHFGFRVCKGEALYLEV